MVKCLMGAPVLLKIAAKKSEPPHMIFLRLAQQSFDDAEKWLRAGEVFDFDELDEATQDFMIDTYKLKKWYVQFDKWDSKRWSALTKLFEE